MPGPFCGWNRLQVLNDVRIGIRTLLRSPGFTLIAVIALALGIGVNSAMFSVADAFLLKPLPLPQIDRLVVLLEQHAQQGADSNSVSLADYMEWRRTAKCFQRIGAYGWASYNLSGGGDAERVLGALVTGDFFPAIGEKSLLGHTFAGEDGPPPNDRLVVLSYGLWRRRFGSDNGIAGKSIKLNSKNYTVSGVMPKGFHFPVAAEFWVLLDPREPILGHFEFQVVARLRDGVSLERARAEMQSIAQRLAEKSPQTNRGWQVRVVPARKFLTGELTVRYTVFDMYAVGFVLLIACANVANLQLARSAGRQKEIAVRTAMGASRWRIVRQLLTESMLVALAGAALGFLLGQWAVDLILANMPPEIAKYVAGWEQIRMDARVFLFTLGIATLAGIVSGLTPAVISSKPNLNETLKETSRGVSSGSARSGLRNMLLVGQIALALTLLVGAGLMVKGVHALTEANRNFAPETLLTMRLALPQWKYGQAEQTVRVYDRTLSALETIPGVTSATLATDLPYGDGDASYSFIIEGRPAPAPGELRRAQIQNISPNYFRAMNIRLRAGHAFSEADSANTRRVAIIGDSFARHYFRGENPLGKRIKFEESEPWKTIVGVADDVHYEWIDRNPVPVVYQPYRQSWWPSTYLAVRSTGDPLRLAPAVRSRIAAIDPELPVFEMKTLDRVISQSLLGLSYVAVIMTVVGAIALVLACVGVYGVMAYTVSQRTREIGIRMALGAERVDVLRMVIGRGLLVTASGLAIGFAIAFVLARILSSLIFGVSATDWQIFFGVSLALAAAALAASYLPARRASRVDPVIALRYE